MSEKLLNKPEKRKNEQKVTQKQDKEIEIGREEVNKRIKRSMAKQEIEQEKPEGKRRYEGKNKKQNKKKQRKETKIKKDIKKI